MEKAPACILVIFGASGDLTERKLIPAVFDLYKQNLLAENFAVLGVGRTELSDESFREKMKKSLQKQKVGAPESQIDNFLLMLYYTSLETSVISEYAKMKVKLDDLNSTLKTGGRYIFYLSTPPSLYQTVANALGELGLNNEEEGNGFRRLIVEKPFGYNLQSARELNTNLQKIFNEDQIYRIDHYLGKETVQNLLVTRFSNGIFEPLWNRNFINYVEITSSESIGVENRGGYYDNAGALRDMVQNHLLQICGLVAMEPPAVFEANSIRNETLKVFQSFRPLKKETLHDFVIRGQYTSATIKGNPVPGYREEKGVNPNSRTETYVALKFFVDNWRWADVPFYIRSGKRLPTRVTEIVIHFKKTPHRLFAFEGTEADNQLIIRIQPDEGILMKIGMKVPGAGFKVRNVNLDFHYSEISDEHLPEAYERLLLDSMLGDATLYARGDAVEACWKFITPILETWEERPDYKLFGYPAGTWGPEVAEKLIESKNGWRHPCKNLSNDGIYCEL